MLGGRTESLIIGVAAANDLFALGRHFYPKFLRTDAAGRTMDIKKTVE